MGTVPLMLALFAGPAFGDEIDSPSLDSSVQQAASRESSSKLQWRPVRTPQMNAPAEHRETVAALPATSHSTSGMKSVVRQPRPNQYIARGNGHDPFEADDRVRGQFTQAPLQNGQNGNGNRAAQPDELPAPAQSANPVPPSDYYPLPMDRPDFSREQDLKDCEQEFAKLKAQTIDQIGLGIRVSGREGEDYPTECTLGNDPFLARSWPCTTFNWKASSLCHKPLYFEEVQLERYGHTCCPYLQPVISGAHFFASIAILPYKMGLQTPDECDYALGYYRPGNCAPHQIEAIGFTPRAGLFQAGAVIGAAAAIP